MEIVLNDKTEGLPVATVEKVVVGDGPMGETEDVRSPLSLRQGEGGAEFEVLSEEAVVIVKESALQYARTGEARSLLQVMTALQDRLACRHQDIQLQANAIIRELLAVSLEERFPELFEAVAGVIRKLFERKNDKRLGPLLAELAREAASIAVELECFEIFAALVSELRRKESREIGSCVHLIYFELALRKTVSADVVNRLVEVVKRGDGNDAQAAAAALVKVGDVALPRLISELKTSDNPAARQTIAKTLVAIAPVADKVLNSLAPDSPPRDCERVMSVFPMLTQHLQRDIRLAMVHPNPNVRSAAVDILAASGEAWARELIVELCAWPDPEIACKAIRAVGESCTADGGETLLRMVPFVTDARIETELYLALGKLRFAPALDVLAKAARGSGPLGLFGSKERIVRAAAVWAITHIPDERAEIILRKLAKDRDRVIAEEASMGLAWRASSGVQCTW